MCTEYSNIAFIVMGVCGVGKTSIGVTLADRLNIAYIEADDYHPLENRKAMSQGIPLSDDMRQPWLLGLGRATEKSRKNGHVVVACSALKQSYRDVLRTLIDRTQFILLDGDRDLIATRLANRTDHFMSASLLDSQIATLEPPDSYEGAITVDIAGTKSQVDNRVEQVARGVLIDF